MRATRFVPRGMGTFSDIATKTRRGCARLRPSFLSRDGQGLATVESEPHITLGALRWCVVATVLTAATLGTAGCGSSHPRTEVLRSAIPVSSDIYIRITGPGGAVSYIERRFITNGTFSKFDFQREHRTEGLFLPPRVRDRKLCASTHVILSSDAPELQQWRGRTLAITVYGRKASTLFCAVLGPELYGPA